VGGPPARPPACGAAAAGRRRARSAAAGAGLGTGLSRRCCGLCGRDERNRPASRMRLGCVCLALVASAARSAHPHSTLLHVKAPWNGRFLGAQQAQGVVIRNTLATAGRRGGAAGRGDDGRVRYGGQPLRAQAARPGRGRADRVCGRRRRVRLAARAQGARPRPRARRRACGSLPAAGKPAGADPVDNHSSRRLSMHTHVSMFRELERAALLARTSAPCFAVAGRGGGRLASAHASTAPGGARQQGSTPARSRAAAQAAGRAHAVYQHGHVPPACTKAARKGCLRRARRGWRAGRWRSRARTATRTWA